MLADRDRRLSLVIGLAVGGFGFQQVSMNALLPALQRTFVASTAWSTWIMTGFLLVGAVTTPLIGRLGDQYGRTLVLRVGLVVFALGCVGCACAPSLGVLIACRALCGISGAFLALGMALIGERLSPAKVAGAIAAIAVSLAIGNVFATLLSPVIADTISWRAVFALNTIAPLGALFLTRGVRDPIAAHGRGRLDVVGAALLATAIASVMLALTEANNWGWTSTAILGLLALALVVGGVWAWVELHVEAPMVDLTMLMQRTVLLTNLTIMLAGAGMFAGIVLVARLVAAPRGVPPNQVPLVDYGFGASTVVVGLILFAQMAVAVGTGYALAPVSRRYGWRLPLVGGLAGLVIALTMIGLWHDHIWQIVLALMVFGLASPMSTIGAKLVADDVRPSEHGVTAGLNMVAFYIGGVVGTQGTAALLEGSRIPGTAIPTEQAYTTSYLVLAVIALLGIPLALMVHPRGRARVRGPVPIMESVLNE